MLAACLLSFLSCSDDNGYTTTFIADEYHEDGEVEVLFENGPETIKLIFIGDGYIKRDLEKTNGLYRKDALKHIEFIFNNPPFSEYRKYFSAYIIYAESKDEGPNYDPRTKSTALEVIQGEILPDRYNSDLLASYIKKIIPDFKDFSEEHHILLSLKNGRGGLASGAAIFPNYDPYTMLHELGHGFLLGDEYEKHPTVDFEFEYITRYNPNLDSIADISHIKWKHFIGLPGYEDVGAYEGGGYRSTGIWRAEENSIMREIAGIHTYFNAPSREAIVKRILNSNGIEYSFETFLTIDKIAMDTINARLLRAKN